MSLVHHNINFCTHVHTVINIIIVVYTPMQFMIVWPLFPMRTWDKFGLRILAMPLNLR